MYVLYTSVPVGPGPSRLRGGRVRDAVRDPRPRRRPGRCRRAVRPSPRICSIASPWCISLGSKEPTGPSRASATWPPKPERSPDEVIGVGVLRESGDEVAEVIVLALKPYRPPQASSLIPIDNQCLSAVFVPLHMRRDSSERRCNKQELGGAHRRVRVRKVGRKGSTEFSGRLSSRSALPFYTKLKI